MKDITIADIACDSRIGIRPISAGRPCHSLPSMIWKLFGHTASGQSRPATLEEARDICLPFPSLSMTQSWRQPAERDFQSGTVALCIEDDRLVVFAEFQDDWIYNSATQKNSLVFLQGDTFEIFLKAADRPDYWELHVTPHNTVMQLHLPQYLSRLIDEAEQEGKSIDVNSFLAWDPAFTSVAWIYESGWSVLAGIPLVLFGEHGKTPLLEGHFARYDYFCQGETPLLSSTGQFSEPVNFHDRNGWSRLHLPARFPRYAETAMTEI